MTLKEHLYSGGVIRFNRDTKSIKLVNNSREITDISCTESDIWHLLQTKVASFWISTPDMVLYAADKEIEITQRDREIFAFLVDHWSKSVQGLPDRIGLQDLYLLAIKFDMPEQHKALRNVRCIVKQ